ncbi:hypothetical protein SK066_12790 [Paenibacillus hunanensis]|uniref:hypothetical protein n=1 Tax=Paenibacillus hunanensis TaxID=539262 RepID=UPI002A69D172|nr:hypothetical protein [Paenibacillus hunanensis]WPP39506.1 hypothetical protein SK066_12790 [Paenibacillus hunanensis]
MKTFKTLLSMSLLLTALTPAIAVHAASPAASTTASSPAATANTTSSTPADTTSATDTQQPEVNKQFFDQQKSAVLRDLTGSEPVSNAAADETSADQLQQADYTYMTVTGEVYSSKRGYLGAAKRDNDNAPDNTTSVTQFDPNNPIPVEQVNGGNTGAFERRQLGFEGFDSITSDITLPTVSGLGQGEQPWVYYGFDAESGKAIEAGYSYQTGTHRWLPYIRSNGFYYGDSSVQKYDTNQVKNVKFYLAKTVSSDTYYNAYFVVDNTQVLIAPTKWTDSDSNSTSVKRVTSIAKKAFTGYDIVGSTMNQRYENVQVSRFYEEQGYPWSQYKEYTENRNGRWYGTIDNMPSYVHRDWLSTSIYNGNNQ